MLVSGKYLICDMLGKGAFSVVKLGRHAETGAKVCILRIKYIYLFLS